MLEIWNSQDLSLKEPFLLFRAYLDPPEWHAAVPWAAWAGRSKECQALADAGAVCGATGADGKGATRPHHACSWEHLCTNTKLRHALLSIRDTQKNVHKHPFHLGRVLDTSPPCPAGPWFCRGLLAFSPMTPVPLWSTGPRPGSSASSCVCAAHLCLLQHNHQNQK